MTKRIAIKDICKIYDGPHATPTKTQSGPIYLGIDAITNDGKLDASQFAHLSEEDYVKWTKRVVPQQGDIVFSYEATLGRYAIIPKGFYGCLGRRLAIIRNISQEIDNTWLYYYFRSAEWSNFIQSKIIKGSTVNRISIEDFPTYTIPYVPIDKQKKIVDVLSKIDKKIQINDEINNNLQAQIKSIYDFWFMQYDFPNENGQPYRASGGKMAWNDILKKHIPLDWSVEPIINTTNIYQPQTISNDLFNNEFEFDVYGGGGLIGRYNQFNHPESEVIISCRGNCGNFYFTSPKSWITGNAMVVSPKNNRLSKYYIYNYLNRYGVKQYLSGSVQKQLTRENLSLMNIVVPPKNILESFDVIVKPIFDKIISIRLEINNLNKLRNYLLPLLMNGQATISE